VAFGLCSGVGVVPNVTQGASLREDAMEAWYFDTADHSHECFCESCSAVASVYAADALSEGLCAECAQAECVCDAELAWEIEFSRSARSASELG